MLDTLISSLGPQAASWTAFFAVFIAVIGVYLLTMYRTDQLRKRLRQIQDFNIPSAGKSSYQEEGFQVHWLKPMGEIIAPEQEWRRSSMKKQLVRAGYRRPATLYIYLGAKLLLTGLGLSVVVLGYILTGNFFQLITPLAIGLLLLAAFVGFNLLQSSVTKFCPAEILLKNLVFKKKTSPAQT